MDKNYFKNFISCDITEKYSKLINGLDDESVKLVNKILYRIQKYAKSKKANFPVDDEELNSIKKFYLASQNSIRMSDKYTLVDGYLFCNEVLPDPSAVLYKHFIETLKNKDKILNGDIIDAGAYNGDTPIVLSKYTNGKVYAFEPERKLFRLLQENIKINRLDNKIIPVPLGLGDEAGSYTLHFDGICPTLRENLNAKNQEHIELATIDSYVEAHNLKVSLIKSDIEGFEQNLLRGAINTLKRDKPVLMISIYHSFDDFFDIKPMIESLNLGYKFTIKKPANLSIAADTLLIAEAVE